MDLLTTTAGRGLALVVLLALTSLVWFVLSRRSGTMRSASRAPSTELDAVLAGHDVGSRATFLQLSSQVCAPCRQVARVLTGLSAREPGIVHLEVDAEAHPQLVRELGVLRTPTVFLLDAAGTVRGRTSGPMTLAQAESALADLAAAPNPSSLSLSASTKDLP